MTPTRELTPDRTLAELAATHAGASRVFSRHRLDFCCHGQVSVTEACAKAGLDPDQLLDELRREQRVATDFESWVERPLPEVVEHVLERFHEPHRAELPRLILMAARVEHVHGSKPDCPVGLADHLRTMAAGLELHMQKEERVLFPMIRSGQGRMALAPIQVMEQEHEDVAAELARSRELTDDYVPPEGACGTWRALYAGLAELERDLMEHVHLENAVLFPRALGRPVVGTQEQVTA